MHSALIYIALVGNIICSLSSTTIILPDQPTICEDVHMGKPLNNLIFPFSLQFLFSLSAWGRVCTCMCNIYIVITSFNVTSSAAIFPGYNYILCNCQFVFENLQ